MTRFDFEIICYSARGIADEKKRKKIFNYLKKKSSTKAIIFVQESHSDKERKIYGAISEEGKYILVMVPKAAGVS